MKTPLRLKLTLTTIFTTWTILSLVVGALVEAQVIVGRIDTPATTPLGWTPSTDPTVSGYFLFEGGAPGVYTNKVQVPGAQSSTYTFSNLLHGTTYYYNIDAYTTNGGTTVEGAYAGELTNTTTPLPGGPSSFVVLTNR